MFILSFFAIIKTIDSFFISNISEIIFSL